METSRAGAPVTPLRVYPAADALGCHDYASSYMRFQGVHAYSIWFPWPSDPPEYDRRIAEAGGIDFFLLASGASDGHVGFNSPGAPSESHTRIVELSEQTRRDNLRTFPAFGTIDNVPRHGITVGIATIAAAREAVMVVWGADKRLTLKRILAADRYDPAWPATVIHACARREITCDADAASVLPARPQFPARPAAP